MIAFDATSASELIARLAAIPTAIAALELLQVRASWADGGAWGWSILRRELDGAPRWLMVLCDRTLGAAGFTAVLAVQVASAVVLPWVDSPWPAATAWACALLCAFRFRGSYNGGSDSMLLVVLGGLALARGDRAGVLETVGLAYIAAQLVLSYFVAGAAKLSQPSWRSGAAVHQLLSLPQYPVPNCARRWLGTDAAVRLCAWGVIGFECLFPLALVSDYAAIVLTAIAIGFHVVNVVVLGLNRFLWTWLAAYPALAYVRLVLIDS